MKRFLFLTIVLSSVLLTATLVHAKTIRDNSTGGDCASMGIWNAAAKTCTMTADIKGHIQFESNNVTLDGNGRTLTRASASSGVFLIGKSGVTVKNLKVIDFPTGILLDGSVGNNLLNNDVSYSGTGIRLTDDSNSNHVEKNSFSNNTYGLQIIRSEDNNIVNNTSSIGQYGFFIRYSDSNTVTGNTINTVNATGNLYGIYLEESSYNHMSKNTVSYSTNAIYLRMYSEGNVITNNYVFKNGTGFYDYYSGDNTIYNNNFISNTTQARVTGPAGSIFNKAKPVGGNYWDNWTTPDADNDGFVDNPYVFTGGQDNLPWAKKNGWNEPATDNIAPVTTAGLAGTSGENGWYISDVMISLSAADNPGGSGVASTEYSLNGGTTWFPYSASFMISTEGETTLQYRSIDNAGNKEAAKSATIKIDKTAPRTMYALTGASGENGWFTSDVNVSLAADDSIPGGISSGVAKTYYRLAGGSMTEYTAGGVMIDQEGILSLDFYSKDNAGNMELMKSIELKVDKSLPTVSILLDGTKGLADWYISMVTAQMEGQDAVSGIQRIEFDLDGAGWTLASGPVVIGDGEHTLKVRGIDMAGNAGSEIVSIVEIDTGLPEIQILAPEPRIYGLSEALVIAYSVMDAVSGVGLASATLDAVPVNNGQAIELFNLSMGSHVFSVSAIDKAGNISNKEVIFETKTSLEDLMKLVELFYEKGLITSEGTFKSLTAQLQAGSIKGFINHVKAQSGKTIDPKAAVTLIDAAKTL